SCPGRSLLTISATLGQSSRPRQVQTTMSAAIATPVRRLRSYLARLARRLVEPGALAVLQQDLVASRAELQAPRADVARLHEGIRSLRNEIAGQFSFLAHDLQLARDAREPSSAATAGEGAETGGVSADALRTLLDRVTILENAILTRLNEVNQSAFEARN